jgi:hypothetical protein
MKRALLIVLLAGCGSTPMVSADKAVARAHLEMAVEQERMLIQRARQELRSDEIEEAAETAKAIAKEVEGYVESSEVREDERATLRIRVPADRLQEVLGRLAGIGDEASRQVESQDVTDQLVDLDARLKNMIALRDRLRKLLDQAETVTDILAVEKELTRIQSDLDAMEARLESLRGQVSLAAIQLTIRKKRILGPLGLIGYGVYWAVSKLFIWQ